MRRYFSFTQIAVNPKSIRKYQQRFKLIMLVHYKKDGIVLFDAPVEKMFRYMRVGDHKHASFKSHKLVSVTGNVVTLNAEIYNPDGTTSGTTITHKLDPPKGLETMFTGGPFDGARFRHTYTPIGNRTRLDIEGDFPAFPGMSEADELKMIDGFFTSVFAEDNVSLQGIK